MALTGQHWVNGTKTITEAVRATGVFTIIKNDLADAVTGTFAGLAESATFNALGKNVPHSLFWK